MCRKYNLLIIISLISIVLDQATKYYIDATMELYQSFEVISGLFNITYIRNSGAAFGFLAGRDSMYVTIFFISVSVIAIVAILIFYKQSEEDDTLLHVALSFIVSGAFGNFLDRAINHEVIDFLDVYWKQSHWPAFNVADACISIGMGLLAMHMLKDMKKE